MGAGFERYDAPPREFGAYRMARRIPLVCESGRGGFGLGTIARALERLRRPVLSKVRVKCPKSESCYWNRVAEFSETNRVVEIVFAL